jgi:hypothetical protein
VLEATIEDLQASLAVETGKRLSLESQLPMEGEKRLHYLQHNPITCILLQHNLIYPGRVLLA